MKKNTEQLDMFMASIDNEGDIIESQKKKEVEEDLTPRQKAVWKLIKYNSLIEHRKTTQREIFEKVEGYEWNDEPTAHDHCPAIWNDIKDNNESVYHEEIIISKNFEYWIGSKEETEQYIKVLWNAISSRLHRYWNIVKKTKLDGTGKMFDENGNPTNDFYKAFNDYDVSMQGENKNESGN